MNIARFLLLMVLLAMAGSAQARQGQPPTRFQDVTNLPDRPAVRRGQELLELARTGEEAGIRAFVLKHFAPAFLEQIPVEEHVEALTDLSAIAGSLRLYGLRTYDPPEPDNRAVLIVRNELLESWEAIVLEVEDQAPHRITSLRLSPARAPADAPKPGPLNAAEVGQELQRFVEKLAGADRFSGTVLLAREDEVLYEGAFGEADMGHHVPNDLDTKFNLGSMNKMFTAVAVAQLAEQGKLSYDDPISKYVDGSWLPSEITDKVRVKHLLTHSSGLGSYFNDTYSNSSRLLFREVDDYKPLVQGETLAFEPGTDWRYSNTGFLLLGVVIEKASSENYFDYIRQHVAEPAGMRNTDCYELDEVVENLATGYFGQGGQWKNNTLLHVMRGGPAGGGYSTVRDLHHFAQALRTDKLVGPATRELLWSPKPDVQSPGYGYGFSVDRGASGEILVGHNGGFPGISSDLVIFTDSGYTLAVMSNRGSSMAVSNKVRELIARIAKQP